VAALAAGSDPAVALSTVLPQLLGDPQVGAALAGLVTEVVGGTLGDADLLALVGPSGAGKSTILRSICGLYRPASGHIVCDGETWLDTGRSIALPAHRRRAGLVFQAYALFPHMTALGNVMAAMSHRPRSERQARAQALIEMVHLTGLEQRKPAELSGGQQQRVALARALAGTALLTLRVLGAGAGRNDHDRNSSGDDGRGQGYLEDATHRIFFRKRGGAATARRGAHAGC
jgi:ABC-type uncharacterized transport system YnjBCD ATPase subunit